MKRPTFLIGLTSDSNFKTERFINSLINLSRELKSRNTWGTITVLRVLPYNEERLSLSLKKVQTLKILDIQFLQCSIDNLLENHDPYLKTIFPVSGKSYSIAAQRNRTLLAINSFPDIDDMDLISILDDDIVFENAVLNKDDKDNYYVDFKISFDYFGGLHKILKLVEPGPIIGGNTGCPPVPATSSLESLIADFINSTKDINEQILIDSQKLDYYYDLSDLANKSKSKGAWFNYKLNNNLTLPSIDKLLKGITPTRPLLFDKDRLLIKPTKSIMRGGNTYFKNKNQLTSFPHLTLVCDDVSLRRSDMIVAEYSNTTKHIYRQTYFPVGHYRMNTIRKRLSTDDVANIITSDLLGVVFHRSVRAYLENKNYNTVWETTYKNRLKKQMKTIKNAKDLLKNPAFKNVEDYDKQLTSLLNEKHIKKKLELRNKRFKREFTKLIMDIDGVFNYWENLIEKEDYEINYQL